MEHSRSKIWKLLDENPLEYVAMALSGEMQTYCDTEDEMGAQLHLQQLHPKGFPLPKKSYVHPGH